MTALASVATVALIAFVAWFVWQKRSRVSHPVAPGYQEDIELPYEQEFELYHNALSLCSMKTRVCLAELRDPLREPRTST